MLEAWLGEGLVPVDQALISVYDRGFRAGEGVFETIRAYGTHPFRLAAHLDRAAQGARLLDFELPARDLLVRAVVETARANVDELAGADGALRVTITPGEVAADSPHPGRAVGRPTLVVTEQPIAPADEVYERGVAATVVTSARELPQVKAVSYLPAALARRQAARAGAYEALLTTHEGLVLEGSFSNVFAVREGTLLTPSVDQGILPGVTRAVVLEVAATRGLPVEQRALPVDEVLAADEVFLTATTREVVPVVRIGDHRVGDGRPGPVTRAVHGGYRDAVRRELESDP